MRKVKVFTAVSILALAVGLFGFGPAHAPPAQAQAANTIIYNLYATDGYVSLADGTPLYMYGFIGGRSTQNVTYQNSVVAPPGAPKTYVPGGLVTAAPGTACTGTWPQPVGGPQVGCEAQLAGNAQFPAPIIYATTNDVVEIRLKNLGVTNKSAPNDPHSIHLHGLDVEAANDGVPETSVGAVPANAAFPGAGNVVVYMFAPLHPGTYMYHCHQEADIHVQMGMYGALVVYNPTDPAALVGPGTNTSSGDLFGWKYDKDVILLLSEIDTRQHTSEARPVGGVATFNPVNYQPQYWLINGLGFPNTIHASGGPNALFNWNTWITAHPGYDPFIVGSVSKASSAGTPGDKILLRVINMGFETQPMHMHGFHGKIIGSDQRAWPWANTAGVTPFGQGLEKNTLTIGSGETYEWLLDFGQQTLQSTYDKTPGGNVASATTQTRMNNTVNAAGVLLNVACQAGVALNAPMPNTRTDCAPIPDPFAVPYNYIGGPTVGPSTGDTNAEAAVLAAGGTPPGVAIPGQFFPFHNHDDYKATNNGVYPGGMFTMLMTVP